MHKNRPITYGFAFSADCIYAGCEDNMTELMMAFIHFIESRELMFGGGCSKHVFAGFVCSANDFQSATEKDRERIENWLCNNNAFSNINIHPLTDAN